MEDKDNSGTFTREAFLHPANLVFLLVGTITALAFNGAGSHLTSTILTMVIGLELLYLGVIPKLPSYQNNIRLKQQKEHSTGSNDKALFHGINGKSQKKFLVLKHITSEVKKSFENQSYATKGMLDHVVSKMEELLSTYLQLLDMHQRYQFYIDTQIEQEILEEVEKQQKKLAGVESEKLKASGERRLAILKKRLNKFRIVKEKFLICETQLETIEDAIRFIYEQSMTMTNPEDVGRQLDVLLTEMDETTAIIQDMDNSSFLRMDLLDQELELATLKKEAEELKQKTENQVKSRP